MEPAPDIDHAQLMLLDKMVRSGHPSRPSVELLSVELLSRMPTVSPQLLQILVVSLLASRPDQAWLDWMAFSTASPRSDVDDYRDLLNERYER